MNKKYKWKHEDGREIVTVITVTRNFFSDRLNMMRDMISAGFKLK